MSTFIDQILPLIAFMLVPAWIPLVSMLVGAVLDLVSPGKAELPVDEVARRRARSSRPEQGGQPALGAGADQAA